MNFEQYKVTVPPGISGEWRVEKFTVNKEDAAWHNVRERIKGMGRVIHPGTYTRLVRGNSIIMSDTPAEIMDHMQFIRRATGTVLINGLGIGMCLKAVLMNPKVEEVTVVELSQDVLNLSAAHYADDRVKFVHDSAFTFKPPRGKQYDAVWHDIWDDITDENLQEMAELHRKYGRRAAWQGSWCKAECQAIRRMYA